MDTTYGKKLFSLKEVYRIFYLALRSGKSMLRAQKSGAISLPFKERIMLAVTKVNHCVMCSYEHTKIALEAGMSNSEIQALLAGDTDNVPEGELPAILFAQHYADKRGYPSKEAWQRILTVYGEEKAHGVLGVTRGIMLGNALGIAFGSLKGRIKGKQDKRSSFLYEISILAGSLFFLPTAAIHAILAGLFRVPLISFPS
jgi:AhpD family alkylhydroperoxidase